MLPLGLRIIIGALDLRMFLTGRLTVPKVSVLPVSKIRWVSLVLLVGGPDCVARVTFSLDSLSVVGLHTRVESGSPRLQVERARADMILLFPPNMLLAVASSLCPSALLLQVALV